MQKFKSKPGIFQIMKIREIKDKKMYGNKKFVNTYTKVIICIIVFNGKDNNKYFPEKLS